MPKTTVIFKQGFDMFFGLFAVYVPFKNVLFILETSPLQAFWPELDS